MLTSKLFVGNLLKADRKISAVSVVEFDKRFKSKNLYMYIILDSAIKNLGFMLMRYATYTENQKNNLFLLNTRVEKNLMQMLF